MTRERFGYEEFGIGLAVGTVLGALLGILLAPDSGATTREKISSRAMDLRGSAEDLVDYAKKAIETASDRLEGVLGLQERGIKKRLEEIRSELEKYNLGGA